MTEQEGLGHLFAKLAKISGELGAVEKDAKHQQNYMYHSADAVMGALNPLLSKYQIVIIPSAANARPVTGADGLSRWVIDYAFTIADGETGAYFVANWTSEGIMSVGKDANTNIPKPDDKSMGKAHTYSLKYWLIQLFKISTKDTSDIDQNNQDVSAGKSQQKQGNQRQTASQKSGQGKQDKKSTNPDDHFGKKEFDMNLLKEITKPLYDNAKHQTNSINKLFTDGVLKADMNVDTAAAYVFRHRAGGKELGFDDNDIKNALGMTLGEFLKRNPRRYGLAWEHLLNHNAKLEKESEFPE